MDFSYETNIRNHATEKKSNQFSAVENQFSVIFYFKFQKGINLYYGGLQILYKFVK
jgi:hypothetical protein